ncbi:MAG: DUF3015 family protein [Spongiibacteraceae bacterium]|jgi:hypothetical protein|nr:DUF3015 family protein [Spongiibacteraceae bacterium]
MKKLMLAIALTGTASVGFADAAGGAGCGWGNMLFDGQSGAASHVLAITTNGTFGNNTFGVTFGTNGCSSSGTISYGGKEMIDVSAVMDEFSEDVARGDGEVVTALAVSLGIAPEDRAAFKATLHNNFATIFPSSATTTDDVLAAIWSVMQQDAQLGKYFS